MNINRDTVSAIASELSLACRILSEQEIVDAYGQISARLPGANGLFVINRGISPALATAGDFLVSDLSGKIIWGEGYSNSEWPIHAAIYQSRPDVGCVLHSHSRLSRIFSLSRKKLRGLLSSSGPEWQDGIPVYREPGLITSMERGIELSVQLGNSSAILLRGHGDVVATSGIKRTLLKAINLKMNADVLHEVLSHGEEVDLWSDSELAVWGQREIKGIGAEHASALVDRAWDYYVARVDGRLSRLLKRD